MRALGPVLLGVMLVVVVSTASTGQTASPDPLKATVSQLAGLSGRDFDMAYMQFMYQQHADVAALAEMGLLQCNDWYLRAFSQKVKDERNDLNRKLAMWYPQISSGQVLSVDPGLTRILMTRLTGYIGPGFDATYCRVMERLALLTYQVANLAQTRSTMPELKYQAKLVAHTSLNESKAFRMWLNSGFVTLQQQSEYCLQFRNWVDPRCPKEYKYPGFYYKQFEF